MKHCSNYSEVVPGQPVRVGKWLTAEKDILIPGGWGGAGAGQWRSQDLPVKAGERYRLKYRGSPAAAACWEVINSDEDMNKQLGKYTLAQYREYLTFIIGEDSQHYTCCSVQEAREVFEKLRSERDVAAFLK